MITPAGYHAFRTGAALVERADRALLAVTGRDRASYLQGLLTNDIKAIGPGRGCYAAYLTPQGRMIADVRVFELGDRLLLSLPAAGAAAVRDRLDSLVFSEDVQVGDLGPDWIALGLYGPAAAAAVAPVVGRNFSSATGPANDVSLADWPPFHHTQVEVEGAPVVVAASDEFGIRGFDLFADRRAVEAIRARLAAAGAVEAGVPALEAIRIESGVPAFGADMDADTIPLEAGLEHRAISFTKGCYVGQEVIVRVRDRGHGRVARRLVGLIVDDEEIPEPGDRLFAGDRDAGRVTSAVRSPALGRPIALGYLHRDFVEPGTRVSVARGDRRLDAMVAALPFVPFAA
jgi:folate-binding protein YgfZ